MCGICGLFGPAQDPALVERMMNLLVHRGPDDAGVLRSGPVSLGFRRLSIIDLAGGHQPIWNESEDVALIGNGEIYNYRELRHDLLERGHRMRSHSDMETVVHLYEDHGLEFLEKLNGMFALALLDTKNHRLILARDRLGIKPLYYSWDGTQLAFASELKALLCLPNRPTALDFQALSNTLAMGFMAGDRTPFAHIRKLTPGHYLEADLGASTITIRSYAMAIQNAIKPSADARHAEGLAARLDQAIDLELRSDVPVGILLSGGLDSSAVLEAATRRSGQSLHAFFVEWEGAPASKMNEWPYAAQMIQQTGAHCNKLTVGARDMLQRMPRCLWHLEEPMTDGAYLPTMLISELAAKSGVKVLLSGCGGDELFGGYGRYERPGVRERLAAIRHARRVGWHKHSYYLLRFFPAHLGILERLFPWFSYRGLSDLIPSVPVVDGEDSRSWQMRFDTRYYLADDLLLLFDKMAMSAGVEGRVPLLNSVLVDYAHTIPVDEKILAGDRKSIFKKALQPRLPASILNRPKDGFGIPLHEWLLASLGDAAWPLVEQSRLQRSGLMDARAARSLLDLYRAGPTPALAWTVWTVVTMEIWFRLFVEDDTSLRDRSLLELGA